MRHESSADGMWQWLGGLRRVDLDSKREWRPYQCLINGGPQPIRHWYGRRTGALTSSIGFAGARTSATCREPRKLTTDWRWTSARRYEGRLHDDDPTIPLVTLYDGL